MVTFERECTKLETATVDHYKTNRETQDVVKGVHNSIARIV